MPDLLVAEAFARRKRENIQRALRFYARALVLGFVVLACSVTPLVLGWWETAVPAAIGTAFLAFILILLVGNLPMEYRAYVWAYFDCDPELIPHPGAKFGRALFGESARLDAWAREAGLRPISDFDSPDVMVEGRPAHWPMPQWHESQPLLQTVDHLLTRVIAGSVLHGELQQLQSMLRAACEHGARCYLLVLSLGGGTNATVEAIRRGEKV